LNTQHAPYWNNILPGIDKLKLVLQQSVMRKHITQ
jgi:hypothetical protein